MFLVQTVSLEWASLVLRLAIGVLFLIHGYPKLKNLKMTVKFMESIGFMPAAFWALVLSVTEFFGSLALLSGLLTKVFSGLLSIVMIVAILVKMKKWNCRFSVCKVPVGKPFPGWEFDFVILAGLVALFLLGPGLLSLDSFLFS